MRAGDRNLLVFLGRTHFYEGRGVAAVVHGVRTAAAAGCRAVVLTNGCGGLEGDLAARHPGADQRPHQPDRHLARSRARTSSTSPTSTPAGCARCASEVDPSLDEGVYVQFPGPHYETPAEIGMVRAIGGDLVGHEHHARGDRRPRGRDGGARHLPGHQPRRRHHRRAAQPRGGPRGRPGRGHPDGRPARQDRAADLSMRVLVTGAAGSIGRVARRRPRRPRPRRSSGSTWSRARRASAAPGTPSTAPTPTPSRRSSPTRPARRRRPPGRHARRGQPARLAALPRGHHRPRCSTRWSSTAYAGSSTPSSNHAVGRTPRTRPASTDDARPRPDTFYGVAKVAAEAAAAACTPTATASTRSACRIGSLPARSPRPSGTCRPGCRPTTASGWSTAALTAPAPGFAVLYGISANTRAWWDLEPGRRLGYHPQDDAEEFAATGRRPARGRGRGGVRRGAVRRRAALPARPGPRLSGASGVLSRAAW